MATLRQIEGHRRAVSDLTTVAIAELVRVWRGLTLDSPREATRQLKTLLPLLIDGYGSATATLAADWYDELRDAAGMKGNFTAVVGEMPPVEQVQAVAGFAVSPLWQADPDNDLALSKTASGVQRLLADIDRDSTAMNVGADPGRPVYVRHASANACAFCAMLATRGAVYGSEASATTVTGRGTALSTNIGRTKGRAAKGIRSRGVRRLGDKYHDNCHCAAVPVWPGQELEQAPYVQKWTDAYNKASRANSTKGEFGAIDTKATLAEMRKILGSD